MLLGKRRAAFIPFSALCSYFICGVSFRCRVDLRYSSSVWLTTELAVLENASPNVRQQAEQLYLTTRIDLAFPDSMGNVFVPVSSCCADLGEFLWVTAHRTPTLQCLAPFLCGRFFVKFCRKADSFVADITFFRSHFHGILRCDAGLIQQLRKAGQNQLCTPLGQQVWPPFCRTRCRLQCRCKPFGYPPCNLLCCNFHPGLEFFFGQKRFLWVFHCDCKNMIPIKGRLFIRRVHYSFQIFFRHSIPTQQRRPMPLCTVVTKTDLPAPIQHIG